MVAALGERGEGGHGPAAWEILHAADRVASAAMWLVVHETYARTVLPRRPRARRRRLQAGARGPHRRQPQHGARLRRLHGASTRSAGITRAWLMGQGHCVAAVDSVNLLLGNLRPAHARALRRQRRRAHPLRARLLRLPARRPRPAGLAARQPRQRPHRRRHRRGRLPRLRRALSTCTCRCRASAWWPSSPTAPSRSSAAATGRRAGGGPRTSGLVAPIMIANGRRIDQRTTMSQEGGVAWFTRHLRLNGFDPIVFDGRDPGRLRVGDLRDRAAAEAAARARREGRRRYPVPLPYGVAVAPKGAGFYGAGTNLAHNLPLGGNPHTDADGGAPTSTARRAGCGCAPDELARGGGARCSTTTRPGARASATPRSPTATPALRRACPSRPGGPCRPTARDRAAWTRASPMAAVDDGFLAIVQANPHAAPARRQPRRDALEPDAAHARGAEVPGDRARGRHPRGRRRRRGHRAQRGGRRVRGARQQGRDQPRSSPTRRSAPRCTAPCGRRSSSPITSAGPAGRRAGCRSRWCSPRTPGRTRKNEQSHQDPAMAEAMLASPRTSRASCSRPTSTPPRRSSRPSTATRGQIWTLVVPKGSAHPRSLHRRGGRALVRDGAVRLPGRAASPSRPG